VATPVTRPPSNSRSWRALHSVRGPFPTWRRALWCSGGLRQPLLHHDTAAALRPPKSTPICGVQSHRRWDGVYDQDPPITRIAVRLRTPTFQDVAQREWLFMTAQPSPFCKTTPFPIVVFDLFGFSGIFGSGLRADRHQHHSRRLGSGASPPCNVYGPWNRSEHAQVGGKHPGAPSTQYWPCQPFLLDKLSVEFTAPNTPSLLLHCDPSPDHPSAVR